MNESPHNNAAPCRTMSAQDFALWGLQDVAYIKRVVSEEGIRWSIHGADGTNIGIAPERSVAFAAVKQHDLDPVSVH